MVVEVGNLRKDSGLLVENLQGLRERVRDSVLNRTIDVADDWILRAWNDLSARIPGVQIQGSFLIYSSGDGNFAFIGNVARIVAGQI